MQVRGSLLILAPLVACLSAQSDVGVEGGTGGCQAGCSHASTGASGRGGSSRATSGVATSQSSSVRGSSSQSGSAGSSGTTATTSIGTNSSASSNSGGASTTTYGNVNGECLAVPLPDAGGCSNGYYVSQEVDLLSCAPIAGGTLQALDSNGTPVAGSSVTTAADGTFVLCAPAGTAFTPFLSAPGYAMYVSELQAGSRNSYVYAAAVSTSDLGVLGAFFSGGVNSELGILIVTLDTSSTCPDSSGWSLSLIEPDGGPLPDGGYRVGYLGPSDVPDPTLTATSSLGAAFFYDIDLSAGNYVSIAASKPDAGVCAPTNVTAFATGRYYLAAESCTIATLQVHP